LWLAALGVAIAVAVGMQRPDDTAGACRVVQPTTYLPELPEASGIAISRRHRSVLWSHNDSGHTTTLFALDTQGSLRARVEVPVRTRDWEDISAAPCAGGSCLYIADIGDNGLMRSRIEVYRVTEPDLADTRTVTPERFTATYADGRHNAEAMFVIDNDVFIVTRDRVGAIYRSVLAPQMTLQRFGQLDLAAVTDAETTPDGRSVAVRTSHEVLVYRSSDMLRGGVVRAAMRIPIDGLKEPQGEGVALDSNGVVHLTSEGTPWRPAGRLLSLRCPMS
jgi:hypothetical protein